MVIQKQHLDIGSTWSQEKRLGGYGINIMDNNKPPISKHMYQDYFSKIKDKIVFNLNFGVNLTKMIGENIYKNEMF